MCVVVIGVDDVYICLRVVRRNVVLLIVVGSVVLATVVVVVVDVVVANLISGGGFKNVTMTPRLSLFISYLCCSVN